MRAERRWSDERVEVILGTLLRAGVLIAAGVVAVGGILYIARYGADAPHWSVFRGEPSDLRSLSGILDDALALSSRGVIQLGLILLIATPIARVVFSVAAFALERDATYVVVTLIVLAVLLYSLVGGI
jgi:uncharacterized membrane protein